MTVISAATDSVWEAVVAWQNRPLERSYPVVYFDALWVKIRDKGRARNKAVYLTLHRRRRDKGCAGHWIEQNEGAKFWLQVMNELRDGGVEDILIAVVDGLKGSPEPKTTVPVGQRADLDRAFKPLLSLLFAAGSSARQGSRTASHLPAESVEVAAERLSEFEASPWGKKYPMIAESWRRNWEPIILFYSYPPEVRHQRDRKFAYAAARGA